MKRCIDAARRVIRPVSCRRRGRHRNNRPKYEALSGKKYWINPFYLELSGFFRSSGNISIERRDSEFVDLTKAEFEKLPMGHEKFLAVAEFLAPLFRPLLRIGFIRRLSGNSFGGQIGTIIHCARRGEHSKASNLAMDALKQYRNPPTKVSFFTGHDLWWLFMYHAAYSLHECGDMEKRDELIEMAQNGVEPFHGYNVANSFIVFAHWKYEEGDYDKAIEFAKMASQADETFAEADFCLGWYYLALGGGDATEQLGRAIRKDHRMFFRIANDPLCREYPHIIQKLKTLSAHRIVTEGNKSGEKGGGPPGA